MLGAMMVYLTVPMLVLPRLNVKSISIRGDNNFDVLGFSTRSSMRPFICSLSLVSTRSTAKYSPVLCWIKS